MHGHTELDCVINFRKAFSPNMMGIHLRLGANECPSFIRKDFPANQLGQKKEMRGAKAPRKSLGKSGDRRPMVRVRFDAVVCASF